MSGIITNENERIKNLCQIISRNIGNRKLAIRWKNKEVENTIFENCGIKADCYFSLDMKKCQQADTLHQSELYGKSDKYYAVILLNWNKTDYEQMFLGGYKEYDDYVFFSQQASIIQGDDKLNHYEDFWGNILETKSKVNVKFLGKNSRVTIGEDVKLLNNLVIEASENSEIYIDNNVIIKHPLIRVGKYAKLHIGRSVNIGAFYLCINEYGTLKIGNRTTIQNGRLQTGRNRSVQIGKDCMFSWDIVILPHDGHLIYDLKKEVFINNTNGKCEESILIGDHCWIGGESVIMPNTVIGTGSVLGYRCMAKGKYPNNCVIVGQPGRVVREDIAWLRQAVSNDESDLFSIEEELRKFTQK